MTLDPAWAGIIGAAVGAVIGGALTFAGNWHSHWLETRRPDSLNERRRERLKGLLCGDKYTWRKIETLKSAVGLDTEATCELLIEIEARASIPNGDAWALIERAPYPEDIEPKA